MTASPLLDVSDLHVELRIGGGLHPVIHDLSLQIGAGEALGLVGESGSGKSMTARAIARLLPPGAAVTGEITFDGQPVLEMGPPQLRRYRTRGIGDDLPGPARAHEPGPPDRRLPHRGAANVQGVPSGRGHPAGRQHAGRGRDRRRRAGACGSTRTSCPAGMLQRVDDRRGAPAEPQLLLADEPTTALDVTTQSEVMAILDELRRDRGMAMLFITHDLELAAPCATAPASCTPARSSNSSRAPA